MTPSPQANRTIRQALAPHLHEIKAGHVDKIVEAITQAMLDMPVLQDEDDSDPYNNLNHQEANEMSGRNESRTQIKTAIKLMGEK